MEGFGQRLRAQRFKQEMSLSSLAEQSGISKGYLSQLENNDEDSHPSMDTVIALARALRLPLSVLVFGESRKDPLEELDQVRSYELWQAWKHATTALELAYEQVMHLGSHAQGGLFDACGESLRALTHSRQQIQIEWDKQRIS